MATASEMVDEFDLTQQNEELQALECIYDTEFSVEDPNKRQYRISVTSGIGTKYTAVLRFTFIEGYPSTKPPLFEVSTPDLPKNQRSKLCHILNDLCEASVGSPVIYSMVETVRSFLEEISDTIAPSNAQSCEDSSHDICQPVPTACVVYTVPSIRDHMAACGRRLPIALGVNCPKVYHGEPIIDRKSVFQAHCCGVTSLPQVSAFISTMLEDRKIASATHNITAWYLQAKLKPDASKTSLVADYDDDGETQAGGRLLHLITMASKEGVVVMVSRWYGGINLGPDRFKHINNAAIQLLTQEGFNKNSTGTADNQKNKDHSKKKSTNRLS